MKRSRFLALLVFSLSPLLSAPSHADRICAPLTYYTKNIQRSFTPVGPPGPVGDTVYANGDIFQSASSSASSLGVFDLSAFATSADGTSERRQVFNEMSFNEAFRKKAPQLRHRCGFNASPRATQLAPNDALNMMGVETYPPDGAILTSPIYFGITSGTGLFMGARGTVKISYNPSTQIFTYTISLLSQ